MRSKRPLWQIVYSLLVNCFLTRIGVPSLFQHLRSVGASLSLHTTTVAVTWVEEQKPDDYPDQDEGWYETKADDEADDCSIDAASSRA